jgi:hypothetical protein
MNLVKIIEFLRNRLKTVVCLCCAVLALLVLLDAIPGIVHKGDAHNFWERLEHFPAFWAVFGFVGCVVLILVSKWYGHLGIMTREDYYDQEPPKEPKS